jgi:two-component system, NarL family, nitrate/nitrite response regulator NarL
MGVDMKAPPPPFLRSTAPAAADAPPGRALGIVILSNVLFLRQSLCQILGRDRGMAVLGDYATIGEALQGSPAHHADVFLLDAASTDGKGAVRRIRETRPEARVVVFAVIETEENVIAWAQVGIAGYVPSTAALEELTTLLRDISAGRQACSARIAAAMMRQIASDAALGQANPASVALLTWRELEILRLIDVGLSNKDIARRLGISLGTTKSHVHNLLAKLSVERRGQAAARMRRRTHDAAASDQ